MSDLPTREGAQVFMQVSGDNGIGIDARIRHGSLIQEWLLPLVAARADGTLQTRQEFIDSLDYEAVADLFTGVALIAGVEPSEREAWKMKGARKFIAAAFEEDTDE